MNPLLRMGARMARRKSGKGTGMGIIGAGRMGGWFTWFLTRRGMRVTVYDVERGRASELAEKTGARAAGELRELAGTDMIMVATPPWEVPRVLEQLAPIVSRGTLVFDIATFKTGIIDAYQVLPPGVHAASAHPLFGPGAPLSTPSAFKVITMEVGGREGEERLRGFFQDLGFRVEKMSWKEHDRVMGLTIGLSFALGSLLDRILLEEGLEDLLEKSGSSFKALVIHSLSLLNQDEKLVEYVLGLPVVREQVRGFARRLESLAEDPQGILEDLRRAREAFGREWLDAAYVSLYRAIETFTLE